MPSGPSTIRSAPRTTAINPQAHPAWLATKTPLLEKVHAPRMSGPLAGAGCSNAVRNGGARHADHERWAFERHRIAHARWPHRGERASAECHSPWPLQVLARLKGLRVRSAANRCCAPPLRGAGRGTGSESTMWCLRIDDDLDVGLNRDDHERGASLAGPGEVLVSRTASILSRVPAHGRQPPASRRTGAPRGVVMGRAF